MGAGVAGFCKGESSNPDFLGAVKCGRRIWRQARRAPVFGSDFPEPLTKFFGCFRAQLGRVEKVSTNPESMQDEFANGRSSAARDNFDDFEAVAGLELTVGKFGRRDGFAVMFNDDAAGQKILGEEELFE
jgi:hypothetical protein